MINDILFGFWFFLPAGVANVTPIFAAKWKILEPLAIPIDGRLTLNHKRLLGNHKTVRGLLVGVVAGMLISLILQQSLVLGFLLSIGALGGDMAKSFIKRRLDIPSGKLWFPFDQLDYIIGGLILSALYVQLTLEQYATIVVLWFLIHILSTLTGYLLKLKTTPI